MTASMLAILPGAPADTEPNDDLAGAELIAPGLHEGQVNASDTTDIYKFEMYADMRWTVNLTNAFGNDIYFSILDGNGTTVASSSNISSEGHQTWTHRYIQGNLNETFYIKAQMDSNASSGYTNYTVWLDIYDQEDATETGDAGEDFAAARNGTAFYSHSHGAVGDGDTSDVYFCQCEAGGNVSVVFMAEYGEGAGDVSIFNSNSTLQAIFNDSVVGEQKDLHWEPDYTGIYYIVVCSNPWKPRWIDYYMNITAEPGTPSDTTPPSIGFLYPTMGMTLDHAAITVSGWANDDFSVAKVGLGVNTHSMETVAEPYVPIFNWTRDVMLSVGTNVLMARVTDSSGWTNTSNISVEVTGTGATNDTVNPWLNITDPTEGQIFDHPMINLWGAAYDDVAVLRVEAQVNSHGWGVVFGTTSFNYNLTLDPGRNFIEVRAVDTSGNVGYDNVTVYYTVAGNDTGAPHIFIYDPVNGSTLHALSHTVLWNASDDVAVMKVEFKINTETGWHLATPAVPEWTHGTYDATLVPGNNTITAQAMDTSGNTAIHWIWVLVNWTPPTNDTTPPWINITSPANWTRLYEPHVNASGTAGDDVGVAKVEVRLNAGAWMTAGGTTSWSASITNIPQGNVSIEARATDTSGLTASAMIWVYYWPDTAPPEVNITSFKNNTEVSKQKVVVRGTVDDNNNVSRLELFVNGEAVNVTLNADGTWEATVSLKEGKNTIDLVAYDTAGNSISSRSVLKYTKPKAQPGFEALFVVAAIVVGLVILSRRQK